jgi:hypothetical protein
MSWTLALLGALLTQAPAPQPTPPPVPPGAAQTLASPAAAPTALQSPAPRPLKPNGWVGMTLEQRAALIATEAERPLSERLLNVSAKFLNTPYVLSPLGEGSGVDPDPTFRLDAVDCLTFVEETLAMSLARRDAEVVPLLERIRYASTPVYEDRNHLMEAQWLPNNVRKGFVVDVTRSYGGEDVLQARKVLTATSWQSKSSAELRLPRERQVQGTFTLDMIPLERVLAHASKVPSGTILVVLRDDLPFKATRVTHVGFVVQKGARTFLRHAARGYNRVVDEELSTFLARNSRYSKWKVTGVSLFEPRVPTQDAGEDNVTVREP